MFSFRNKDLPEGREFLSALQTIKGVGLWKSMVIGTRFGFAYPFFINNLNFYGYSLVFFLLRFLVMNDNKVKRVLSYRIRELIDIQCYRGFRHSDSLPVRGQRTRTNAKTFRRIKGL